MNKYVIDTMAFILRLENRKMPDQVKEKFKQAENGNIQIIIPSMVFAELDYLSECNRIDTNLEEAKKYLDQYSSFSEKPLDFKTIKYAFEIHDIPELHDRLIAASSKELNIKIITNDTEIMQSSHVKTIWN